MIKVDWGKVKEPLILSTRGVAENTAAAIYYATDPQAAAYPFSAYRHQTVKQALITLFHGKCAYCESRCLHVYSGDIEHFRPKGEITGALPGPRPGYYWLAANWDNLLFSCRNCNQKLTHQLFGVAVPKTMGKMNQFPLADEMRMARPPLTDLRPEEEVRLLLDPCTDNPEEHLEYDDPVHVARQRYLRDSPSQCIAGLIVVNVLVKPKNRRAFPVGYLNTG